MRNAIVFAGLMSCFTVEPASVQAHQAQPSAAHWGTFAKNESLRDCLSFATDALWPGRKGVGVLRIGVNRNRI
jgi:hypothetical protein